MGSLNGKVAAVAVGVVIALCGGGGALAVPAETACVQGTLADASGQALSGTRAWRVQFHDAQTSGTALGEPSTGTTTLAASGRFSLILAPPSEVVAATGEVWYELAIDSADPPDDLIDPDDVFPNRVLVHSVLFARLAAHADTATTATNAMAVGAVAGSDLATDAELTSGLSAKADTGHNHDALYAAILHNHTGVYALIGHTHDLQDLGGAVTDGQVPNNISIDYATSAGVAGHSDTATTATYASRAGSVKQVVCDFVVASGGSVSAGDVVAFLDGKAERLVHGSGESIFNNGTTAYCSPVALSETRFAIAYTDGSNSDRGTVIIGETSGAEITCVGQRVGLQRLRDPLVPHGGAVGGQGPRRLQGRGEFESRHGSSWRGFRNWYHLGRRIGLQQRLARVRRRGGAVVRSSCRRLQRSWELQLRNGGRL